jgi:non-lysosomal glucosylceramidase
MAADECGCRGRCSGASGGGEGGTDADSRKMDRREFVATAASGSVGMAALAGLPLVAGPFSRQEGVDHFVPADKKLTPRWLRLLVERGESTWYSGSDLLTIGMPVGGICAGQVYLTGDGRLACWDIFNRNKNTGYGAVNYEVGRTPDQTVQDGVMALEAELSQGFALRVRTGEMTVETTLDRRGFPGVRFCGEYPIGRVEYADSSLPVSVSLEAFSPFIPLDAASSSLPATILRYTVRNTSNAPAEVTLAGWLENAVCRDSAILHGARLRRRNRPLGTGILTGVLATAEAVPQATPPARPPIVFADFEGKGYGDWTANGAAFGQAPATGTLPGQQHVSGFQGAGLVNSFLGGDAPRGTLRSPAFTIERPYIGFLIGGGRHEQSTCMNLVVDGAAVRTATGENRERLAPRNWDVSDLAGRTAHLEIVDAESGGWGHINVDQIEFRDSPMVIDPGPLDRWPDYGSLCLALVGDGFCRPSLPDEPLPDSLFGEVEGETRKAAGEMLCGAAGRTFTVGPDEAQDVVFVLSWCLPNMYREETLVGNHYATRFTDAASVAQYVALNLDRLVGQTRLWHRCYYDSTLPHWLLDRLHSTVANLATTTCQWWANGRFWAWEGAGCCQGTCGHVWNYEHALARIFPELERSVREMQDFAPGVGFHQETGAIGFRGEGWTLWAGDAQGGYILKALREHLTSPDPGFLKRNWPAIRKATAFLVTQDGNADGLIEGPQHQTYDENYFGANTMVGSLYLGALRAAEVMASEMDDAQFAGQCRTIFEAGRRNSMARLFNGEYFIQAVDLKVHPDWQYANGCLADQLFGQGWAHQVGLGYLYPEHAVMNALRSVWKYCWAPDVGPQNSAHAPERWFARPGEAGLFTCTWPRSPHLGPKSTRYRNEIWTGIEYQVAGHMAWEGMTTEALALCRGVHERYHPSKHNPWNEIECGDHYARSMASWGVLIGLSGFEYRGPDAHIGFAPRLTPADFRCAFTAAEGWGSLSQAREADKQTCEIALAWGRLPVHSIALEAPDGVDLRTASATLDGRALITTASKEGRRVTVNVPPGTVVEAGSTIRVALALPDLPVPGTVPRNNGCFHA